MYACNEHVCLYAYIHMHAHMYTNKHVLQWESTRMCLKKYHVCVYCILVYTYALCSHTTHTRKGTIFTEKHTQPHTRTHTHIYMRTHTHTHAHAQAPPYASIYIRTHAHSLTRTHTHAHAPAPAHIHTHVRTHPHTYAHTRL